jgi:hypothetical protein
VFINASPQALLEGLIALMELANHGGLVVEEVGDALHFLLGGPFERIALGLHLVAMALHLVAMAPHLVATALPIVEQIQALDD